MWDESKRQAFQAADDAWQAELVRQFGKRAGDVRYTPQGRGEAVVSRMRVTTFG